MTCRRAVVCSAWVIFGSALGLFLLDKSNAQTAPPSAAAPSTAPAGDWQVLVDPQDAAKVWFLKDRHPVAYFEPIGWGPGWAYAGFNPVGAKGTGDDLHFQEPWIVSGKTFQYTGEYTPGPNDTVICKYDVTGKADLPLTMLAESHQILGGASTGSLVVTFADGTTKTLPLHNPRAEEPWQSIKKLDIQIDGVGTVTETYDPPIGIMWETNNPRIQVAGKLFHAPKMTLTMTISATGPVKLLASPQDRASFVTTVIGPDWFAFNPKNDHGPSAIGMQDWLDAPAGKHGGVRMVGDHFQLEDGTPIKFWGTNLAYGVSCAPAKADADATSDFFAKYGVNAVRLHKFTGDAPWTGINDPKDALKFDPAAVKRFDYFTSQLKSKGIYYGFSHTYHFTPGPDNASALLDYKEIKSKGGDTYGLINFAPDIQDLLIQRIVGLLNHVNPNTQMKYADDPGLGYVEIQNEDDIFFFTTAGMMPQYPTYTKAFYKRFSEWLGKKYGSQEALAAAWGSALHKGEAIDAGNIVVEGNPWFMGEDHLPQLKGVDRVRMLDNAAFEHEEQNNFYGRTVKAIRDTGYKGPICGSPWQAPAMLPELLNIKSDYNVGWIDRHNYGGGGITSTMMGSPGGSYLATGLQQVIDRPFGISEWITGYPDLYSAEGPALMAIYGMGLQGWDASYEFQSHMGSDGFTPICGSMAFGFWDADVPTQIGQYPALGRMIARGDVKEGPIISDRKISPDQLANGTFNFSDRVVLHGDVKQFGGSTPAKALAAGRCVLEFTDHDEPSTFADMAKYTDGSAIVSNTGQLRWETDAVHHGFVTVNTDGTKAVVGFAQDKPQTLGNVTITTHSPYVSLFLTASNKGKTLADDSTAIITAVSRNCNTGFRYSTLNSAVMDNGKPPIMLEPVKADFTIAGRPITAVNVLDQDGRVTDQTLPVQNGAFSIDTGVQKTMYYQVVFGK